MRCIRFKVRAVPAVCALMGMLWFSMPVSVPAAGTVHAAVSPPGRLPGDNPPPRWMLLKPPPVPTPGHPGPDMYDHAPGPTLAEALAVAKAALSACTAKGRAVGVAVLDSSGQPRVALVADGALGGNVYTAVRKGLTALAFKEPTSKVNAQIQGHRIAPGQITANMIPWAGGVPLWRNGKVIGAVAVSGSMSTQDEACARIGRRLFESYSVAHRK